MRKSFFVILVWFACVTTAYSQVKTQFIEVQAGQSIMLQGAGYSLFDKSFGDNNSFGESMWIGERALCGAQAFISRQTQSQYRDMTNYQRLFRWEWKHADTLRLTLCYIATVA